MATASQVLPARERPWTLIGRCRVRSGINNHDACPRWAVCGRCLTHWLDELRWEWEWQSWSARLDLSNINRPYVQVDEQRPITWVALSYGNGNSDPVCSVEWNRRGGDFRV
jgi:hypothetical protein